MKNHKFQYGGKMDKECIGLCDAINNIEGLKTYESCCGHGKDEFVIFFEVIDIENLPVLLYFCDPCHVGFRWDCMITTDCVMSPVHYRIQSRTKGKEAYGEADIIAKKLMNYLRRDI